MCKKVRDFNDVRDLWKFINHLTVFYDPVSCLLECTEKCLTPNQPTEPRGMELKDTLKNDALMYTASMTEPL